MSTLRTRKRLDDCVPDEFRGKASRYGETKLTVHRMVSELETATRLWRKEKTWWLIYWRILLEKVMKLDERTSTAAADYV